MLKQSIVIAALCASACVAQTKPDPLKITVDWAKDRRPLKTTATLQVVVNPMLQPGAPTHDGAYAALKSLGAEYVRYVPWLPYPRLAVAELEPPTKTETSWDFKLIDPMTLDFLRATEGHERMLNFSTQPAWLFKQAKPVKVNSTDPNAVQWDYVQGKELRDPSGKELADYYARLVGWYTQGGFTDEIGKRHESGYHFQFPWWEVFNEPDIEHQPSPELYVKEYDAIVERLHAMDPRMKFVGLGLAFAERDPRMVEYFLNHKNHKPGIPLDMISYHFYATPTMEQTVDQWQYTFFDQSDRLITAIRFIEEARKRLSPETKTTLNEIGSILPTDSHTATPENPGPPIPAIYWNVSGALYAHVYLEAARLGIDVVGESQLVGYPSQYPSVSLVDWKTGRPNARFDVLRLIHDELHPGATLAETKLPGRDVDAQAIQDGNTHKLLLINKRNRSITIELPEEFAHATLHIVAPSGEAQKTLTASGYDLPPFAVVVLDVESH